MAATRTRRRRRSKDPLLGKEVWQIVGPDGDVLYEGGQGEGATLIRAQTLAQRLSPDLPTVSITVKLKPWFGEPDSFYTVRREEDGSVRTYPA